MARSLTRMPTLVAETREERVHDLGVECPSLLEWKHWRAGGEYRKSVTVRNVSQKHQRIKYALPSSGAFSMEYPEELHLSPGMSATLVVIFKPGQNPVYSDKIIFSTAKGAFAVRLEGRHPGAELVMPSHLDFGFCPVKESTPQAFAVRNTGHVPLAFSWECVAPFGIAPARGTLQPGEAAECTAAFAPDEASSFTASATCTTSAGATSSLTLVGVGKYPFLSASTTAVDFGEVLSGSTVDHEIILTNAALVAAAFELRSVNGGGEERGIRVTPTRGRLLPNERIALRVTYSPSSAGTSASATFEIPTATGRSIRIECSGSAVGPRVTLSASGLNFGMVRAGTDAVRSVRLENHSGMEVAYQLRGTESGPFSVEVTTGTCPAFGSATVTVRFDPKDPLMYHKRLFLLIRDHAPLAVTLIGSCFNDKMRPPLLNLKQFRNGSSVQGEPDCYEDPNLEREEGTESPPESNHSGAEELERWEALFAGAEERTRVHADVTRLDFGACARGKPSEFKPVTLTNDSEERVTCTWMTPEGFGGANPAGSEGVKLYQVFPQEAEIRPGGSFIFNVVFRPKRDNCFYCDDLEVLVVPKRLRQWDAALAEVPPPSAMKVRAIAHTFKPGADHVMPRAQFSSESVALPPSHVGDPSFQTSVIYNQGDTPLKFEIRPTSLDSPFKVHPTEGVILGHEFQVLAYRFCSETEGSRSERVLCFFNNSPANPTELRLTAGAFLPRVELTEDGNLGFRPTCVGAVSERGFAVRNLVKIPVRVSWAVPPRWAAVIGVQPGEEILRGGETREFAWSFAPREPGVTSAKVQCFVSGVRIRSVYSARQDSGPGVKTSGKVVPLGEEDMSGTNEVGQKLTSAAQKVTLSVTGEGISGVFKLTPEELDLGTLLVGAKHRAALTLHNLSDGPLQYALDARRAGFEDLDEDELEGDTCLKIEAPAGTIPARSSVSVPVSLRPSRRAEMSFEVTCARVDERRAAEGDPPGHVSWGDGTELSPENSWQAASEPATCLVTARADYPTLTVADVRSDGVSKDQLWRQLRAGQLNQLLAGEPGELERRLNGGKESADWAGMEDGLERHVVDLGAAVTGGKKVRTHLELKNTGLLTSKWNIRLWGKESVSLESWVQTGKPRTSEDKHRAQVREENLFEVRPRGGTLSPDESCHVSIEYQPGRPGTHRLPALLEISKGRRTLLNLVGRTLEFYEKLLIFSENPFDLGGVVLGERRPPLRGMTLRNGGPSEIRYQLDTQPLTRLSEANHGFDVLTVRNPEGCIPVGESVQLEWLFTPIEEREYEVELPLLVWGAETTYITLRGRGVRPEYMSLPETPGLDLGLGYNPRQTLNLPNQRATLSVESINFEHVPELSVSRRLVTVRNRSSDTVRFSWRPSLAADSLACGRLKVEPERGTMAPGAECVCKAVMTAGTQPAVFEATMICDVAPAPSQAAVKCPGSLSPSSPGATRTRGSVRWDTGKENKKLPLRIAGEEEVIVDTFRKIGKDTQGRAPLSHQSVLEATTESYRTRRDGRNPGGTVKASGTNGTAQSGEQAEDSVSSLFLTLTGHVHSGESYRSLFGESGSHFLVENPPAVPTESAVPGPQDREVVGEVLETILREAFRDPDVRTACEAGPVDGPCLQSAEVPTWASMRRKTAGEAKADRGESGELLEVSPERNASRPFGEAVSDGYPAGFSTEGRGEAAEESGEDREGKAEPRDVDGEVSMSAGDVMLNVMHGDREERAKGTGQTGAVRSIGVDQAADLKRLAEFVLEGTLFSVVKDALKDKDCP